MLLILSGLNGGQFHLPNLVTNLLLSFLTLSSAYNRNPSYPHGQDGERVYNKYGFSTRLFGLYNPKNYYAPKGHVAKLIIMNQMPNKTRSNHHGLNGLDLRTLDIHYKRYEV